MAWLSPGRDARSCRAPIWVCRAPMLKSTLPFSKASARWWDGTPVRESYLGKGRVNSCPSRGPRPRMQEEPGGFSALCVGSQPLCPSRLIPVGRTLSPASPDQPTQGNCKLRARGKPSSTASASTGFAAEAAIPSWRLGPDSLPTRAAPGGMGKAAPTSGRRHPGFWWEGRNGCQGSRAGCNTPSRARARLHCGSGCASPAGMGEETRGWEERGKMGGEMTDLWSCTCWPAQAGRKPT